MSKAIIVDIFAEDTAHEKFLKPVINKLASQLGISVTVRILSARGGHGRAVSEYILYQHIIEKGIAKNVAPDIIVVAIDCNCKGYSDMERDISAAVRDIFKERTVFSLPDPHIERWYLADPSAANKVFGIAVKVPRKKCKRDFYKNLLAETVIKSGHPPSLGGIEFAEEIVDIMDFYAAGKTENSLRFFVKDMKAALKKAAET
jgi:hypothetical protein